MQIVEGENIKTKAYATKPAYDLLKAMLKDRYDWKSNVDKIN